MHRDDHGYTMFNTDLVATTLSLAGSSESDKKTSKAEKRLQVAQEKAEKWQAKSNKAAERLLKETG